MKNDDLKLLTVREAAELTGKSLGGIYLLLKKKLIDCTSINCYGRDVLFIKKRSLMDYMAHKQNNQPSGDYNKKDSNSYITLKQMSEKLGVCSATMHNYKHRYKFPSKKIGSTEYFQKDILFKHMLKKLGLKLKE